MTSAFPLWLPIGALLVVGIAVIAVALAFLFAARGVTRTALVCIVLAAAVLRAYASADRVLHPWDERYHALVAKNLISNPLVPTLYSDPVLPYDYKNWTGNHIWLHKPPMALWMQAASMRLFGIHEYALRLPSVLLSTAAVGVTFVLGTSLFSPMVGTMAAGFHAFNGFAVDLASGRRVSDHVDTLLLFLAEFGLVAAVLLHRRHTSLCGVALGLACGLGYLTKSLMALPVLLIWIPMRRLIASRTSLRELLLAVAVGAAVAGPWMIYTRSAFPVEFTHERAYAFRHMFDVLENQGGPAWQYVWEMPRYFGELIYVPLGVAIFWVLRRRASSAVQALLVWVAIPYLMYSSFKTKMPAYVMVAAPALFVLQACVWFEMWKRCPQRSKLSAIAAHVGLIVLALLPARHLLSPTGPLEARERHPKWVQDLKSIDKQVTGERAVIFNTATPIEAMFYTSLIAYEKIPTDAEAGDLQRRGYKVYLLDDAEQRLDQVPPGVMRIRP